MSVRRHKCAGMYDGFDYGMATNGVEQSFNFNSSYASYREGHGLRLRTWKAPSLLKLRRQLKILISCVGTGRNSKVVRLTGTPVLLRQRPYCLDARVCNSAYLIGEQCWSVLSGYWCPPAHALRSIGSAQHLHDVNMGDSIRDVYLAYRREIFGDMRHSERLARCLGDRGGP
jgi:hypothetical protein